MPNQTKERQNNYSALMGTRTVYSIGVIGGFMVIQTYIIDNCTIYAASAVGAGASLRSLAGFGFPLFASMSKSQTIGP